ncbi:MAG TPA: alanine racemase [Kiritimatiellia bacterium]|nr:alanine racemase [Kiritimatiellia bacterium]
MISPWIQIDLAALDRNVRTMRTALAGRTSLVMVVKANAYGHGLTPVARQAARSGVRWFAVAYLREALQVRAVCEDAEIVILGAVMPDDVRTLVENRLLPVVVDEAQGRSLALAARARGEVLRAHLKIDTGMGRFGVPWQDAVGHYERLAREPGLELTGLCTHFASVEPRKPSLGPEQMERFLRIDEQIRRKSASPLFRHVSSSRAFLYQSDWDLDGVRPGIAAYGYGARERGMRVATEPLLQWRTGVMQVKRVPAGFAVGYYSTYVTPAPTTLATLAVGYADGYHRALSNKGFVLIRGRRCAVVGRVSMNWITVDCGPDADVAAGDEAVLIGRQGEESIWADELARLARTIPYEMLTSIHAGCERHYMSAPNLPIPPT